MDRMVPRRPVATQIGHRDFAQMPAYERSRDKLVLIIFRLLRAMSKRNRWVVVMSVFIFIAALLGIEQVQFIGACFLHCRLTGGLFLRIGDADGFISLSNLCEEGGSLPGMYQLGGDDCCLCCIL